MKFRVLKIERRWWSPFSLYPTRVTIKLEDGTVFKVNSWALSSDHFLSHIIFVLKRRLKAKQAEQEQPTLKRSQVLSHMFDTQKSYDENWLEINNLDEATPSMEDE